MDIAAIVVASLSALIAILAFYLTQVRPAKLEMIVERRIRVGPTDGSGFQFYISCVFANRAQRTGMIHKISITLSAKSSLPVYYIDASRFCELQGGRRMEDVELPHAFAVPGQSTVSKLVRFCWWNSSHPPFDISDGCFELKIYAWNEAKGQPNLVSEHLLRLSESQLQEIQRFQQKKEAATIEAVLDEESPNNRIIAEASPKLLSIP